MQKQQQLLQQYHKKVTKQEQHCAKLLTSLKVQVQQQFLKQLDLQFSIFQGQFHKTKHNLDSQLKTLEYYLQNYLQKHSSNPKQNNLYPFFNQIDHKIHQNHSYIQTQFYLHFSFPQTKLKLNQNLNLIKAQIMQKQLEEIRSFLAHNQNIRKHCNQQLHQIKQIHEAYERIYQLNQKQYFTPELNFIGTLSQALLTLKLTSNIEKLNLSIRNHQGKMTIQELQSILNALSKNKNLLTHIHLKIMDMEFQSQKCNLIRTFVKQLKVIQNFKLQNYYKENKLGNFEDFNWFPLKKSTHIIGKVW